MDREKMIVIVVNESEDQAKYTLTGLTHLRAAEILGQVLADCLTYAEHDHEHNDETGGSG